MHTLWCKPCHIGVLMAILYTVLVWTAQAGGDSRFDFPVGPPYTSLGTHVTEVNDGDGWYVFQEFGTPNPAVDGKMHLGEDWNSERGALDDLGKPVYAAASGTVIYAHDAGTGWNGVIIIHHEASSGAPFVLPDGRAVSEVWTLYGHLDVAKINDWVVDGQTISKNAQIGIIGPTPAGSTGPHLHFEIRYTNPPDLVGPGYSFDTTGWVDPSDFINANRPCHTYTSTSSIPPGFGVPWDTTTNELLIKATCTTSSATIDLGRGNPLQYIYRIGYHYRNGMSGWMPVNYTSQEQLIVDAWYPKTAQGSITTDTSVDNYGLAYICTWMSSLKQWKCGCRDQVCTTSYWQIQQFKQ